MLLSSKKIVKKIVYGSKNKWNKMYLMSILMYFISEIVILTFPMKYCSGTTDNRLNVSHTLIRHSDSP